MLNKFPDDAWCCGATEWNPDLSDQILSKVIKIRILEQNPKVFLGEVFVMG